MKYQAGCAAARADGAEQQQRLAVHLQAATREPLHHDGDAREERHEALETGNLTPREPLGVRIRARRWA